MRIPHPFRKRTERQRANDARVRSIREEGVRQTRRATVETGGDWGDGRWERTRWENGRPARTYRGTRARSR